MAGLATDPSALSRAITPGGAEPVQSSTRSVLPERASSQTRCALRCAVKQTPRSGAAARSWTACDASCVQGPGGQVCKRPRLGKAAGDGQRRGGPEGESEQRAATAKICRLKVRGMSHREPALLNARPEAQAIHLLRFIPRLQADFPSIDFYV